MTARRFVICGAVALLTLAASTQGAGQFRSGTSLVHVDAVVIDRDGRFVGDLTADDFTLFEDGKPQKIDQFFLVTYEGEGRAAPTEDRARRVFVILFDEGHLASDSLMRVRTGAERFVEDHVGPGDLAGIFVNGAMYRGRLSDSRAELLGGIRSVRPAFDYRQKLLAAFREFPRIPGEVDALRIMEGARQVVDRLGEQACREQPRMCAENGGINQVEDLIEKKARAYIQQARVLSNTTFQNLQYVLARLNRMPGRKTLVLLTEGFFVEDNRAAVQTLAAHAARGGTVIYTIDGRGLIQGATPTPDVDRQERGRSTLFDGGEDGPAILAAMTGGLRLANIDDIGRAFNMIARDTSTYYVLGYQPDRALDGRFRKIDVKTRMNGVRVRARKGYVASPQ